ncbi:hypothetical protein [Rothia aerolata]|uniref:Uncharacterized protein n=1 Tax=Rothia aerolata TaxID=1812262 RepID=A0A917IT35_9MICC|nr:hypothetical protein [Rothia aerolata]GGH61712.1 hypothetical protein GCM10007359_11160 [Rothia aerolata]
MAYKQLPPPSEEEIRELIHQIIRRMIAVGLVACLLGALIIGAMALWDR